MSTHSSCLLSLFCAFCAVVPSFSFPVPRPIFPFSPRSISRRLSSRDSGWGGVGLPPRPPPPLLTSLFLSEDGEGEQENGVAVVETQLDQWLKKYPVKSKIILSMLTSALGSVISQFVVFLKLKRLASKSKREPGEGKGGSQGWLGVSSEVLSDFRLDLHDFTAFVLMGGILGGILHWWFTTLETVVASSSFLSQQKPLVQAFVKLGLDQSVWAMSLNAALYFGFQVMSDLVALDFRSPSCLVRETLPKLRRDYWPMMRMNWRIWPASNLVNFLVIPSHYQVLFANWVAIFWNAYLAAIVV